MQRMRTNNRRPVVKQARDLNVFIGIELRRAREKSGHTQAQVAEVLGYRSPQPITRMEKGENMVSAADLARISRFLGVTVRSLFPRGSVR